MSEQQDTQAVATEAEETAPVAEETPQPAAVDSVDQLPDWAQKLVKDLRSENAKHRTANKAVQKEKEEAERKAAEEQGEYKRLYEAEQAKRVESETEAANLRIARIRDKVARELKLPGALVDRLQGETEEEITADAQALLEAMPKPQAVTTTDAGNGVNPTPAPVALDEETLRRQASALGVNADAYIEQVKNSRSK